MFLYVAAHGRQLLGDEFQRILGSDHGAGDDDLVSLDLVCEKINVIGSKGKKFKFVLIPDVCRENRELSTWGTPASISPIRSWNFKSQVDIQVLLPCDRMSPMLMMTNHWELVRVD